MTKSVISKKAAAVLFAGVIVLTGFQPTHIFAATPLIEEAEYKGNGVVDVEFQQDVEYKNVRVKVKDNKGKSYKASVIIMDSDDLTFKIKKIKNGRTYKYTIKGIRSLGQGSYGKAKGTIKLASMKNVITASKAKKIALSKAGVKENEVFDLEVEKEHKNGQITYEVNFESSTFEYEYIIAADGSVLHSEKEYND